jgi:hypothetical protein
MHVSYVLKVLSSFASIIWGWSSFVYRIDEDNNLDIFEREVNTNEFEKEVLIKNCWIS